MARESLETEASTCGPGVSYTCDAVIPDGPRLELIAVLILFGRK